MRMYLSAKEAKNPDTGKPYLESELHCSDTGSRNSTDSTGPASKPAIIVVDGKTEYQALLGFGGAFTQSAAVTYAKMGKENQRRILEAYFDTDKGLGYALGRVAIASSDFCEDMYDYLTGEDLDTFDISREEREVFPMVRAAADVRGSALRLLASPWSPPAFMKDNKERKHGGTLLPEYAGGYAAYIVRFVTEARQRGIPVEFLSVQNEPEATQTWDSCRFTAEQERDFVKNHLGPALRKAGLIGAGPDDIKLLIHDHNRGILLERALKILEDKEAAQYIWGSAIHWYVDETFSASSELHKAHPDKHLLFTEGCIEGGPAPGNWGNAERYARNIIGDLSNCVEGWIDWNLVLDAQGGPNHVGNYCCAPILCDVAADKLTINPSYHIIGHFARHIKPGAIRIGSSVSGDVIKVLAARNPDGSHIMVALNETDNAQSLSVSMGGECGGATLPAHSIATFIA